MTTLHAIETEKLRRDLPPFRTGDTVRVHVRVTEGDKQRIQVFEGVVIRRRKGGASGSFTVRKVSYGVGVERVFPVESPSVAKVEIKSRGHVRRSRIYFMRELRGKKARLRSKVRDLSGLVAPDQLDEEPGTAAAATEEAALPDAEASAEVEPSAETQPEQTSQEPAEQAGAETEAPEPKASEKS